MLVLQRDELKSAIERVAQFADERSRAIRFKILRGELKVHSSISETGESEETIPVEYYGDRTWKLDSMLSTCSNSCVRSDQSEMEFHFKDANSAGELRPHAGAAETRLPLCRNADAHLIAIGVNGEKVLHRAAAYQRCRECCLKSMATVAQNENYDSTSIKVLEGLEAVRLRPAMYIGSTGEMGLHHLVYEVVDNSVDEALAGYCTEDQCHHPHRQLDHGRRQRPRHSGRHPRRRRRFRRAGCADKAARRRQVRFQYLQSFRRSARRGRQLRERACPKRFTWKSGAIRRTWEQDYERGIPKAPLAQTGKSNKTGTKITFKPDPTIMDATRVQFRHVGAAPAPTGLSEQRLKIILTDERGEDIRTEEFFYSGGIAEFIKHLNRGKAGPARQADSLRRRARDAERRQHHHRSWRCSTTTPIRRTVFSFANNINTVDGGTHLSGFRSALTRTINAAATAKAG